MFSEIEYSIQQQDLLENLENNYVLKVTVLKSDCTIIDIYQSCMEAAKTAIKVFDSRILDYNKILAYQGRILPVDIDKRYKLYTYPDILPKGKLISLNEFIGKGLNIETLTLTRTGLSFTESNLGLIFALFHEPHGGGVYRKGDDDFIRDFFAAFLPSIENYIIYKWSDDWSNYFDSGKEYWGTFFWTLYNKTTQEITVIAALATD